MLTCVRWVPLVDRKTLRRCIKQLIKKKLWLISTTGHLKEVRPACFDCYKFCQIFFLVGPRGSFQIRAGMESFIRKQLGHNHRYLKFLINGLVEADCLPLRKVLHNIVQERIEFKASISVEQDWSILGKDCNNNKLSYKSEDNPRLGQNRRFVKLLSNGLKVSRSRLSFSYKSTTQFNIVLNFKLGHQQNRTGVLHEKTAITTS